MRITLIAIQAIALSTFVVLGAHGDTGDTAKCPVSEPVAARDCGG